MYRGRPFHIKRKTILMISIIPWFRIAHPLFFVQGFCWAPDCRIAFDKINSYRVPLYVNILRSILRYLQINVEYIEVKYLYSVLYLSFEFYLNDNREEKNRVGNNYSTAIPRPYSFQLNFLSFFINISFKFHWNITILYYTFKYT